MQSSSKERNIIMTLQAIKRNLKLSIRRASEIYEISRTTLANRRNNRQSKRDILANLMNLTNLEKKVIFDRIINLVNYKFLSR